LEDLKFYFLILIMFPSRSNIYIYVRPTREG
jgi:hypothetical protein